jgi:hypothetical protein
VRQEVTLAMLAGDPLIVAAGVPASSLADLAGLDG